MKVLIVDGSPETLNTLSFAFKLRWPECAILSTGQGSEAIALTERENPHLIITEIALPDMTGFEVIKQIRLFSEVPIMVLTEKRDEMDVVRALEFGADDYIFKPPSTLDFLARARAIMRRSSLYPHISEDVPPFVADNLVVDFAGKQVFVGDKQVHLTPTEYVILCHLVRNAGRVVTIDTLRQQIWGDIEELQPSTIRKAVSQLRHKLDNGRSTNLIQNERGIGYKFAAVPRRPGRTASASLPETPFPLSFGS
jgi:two-component system KDP operon response regulator KdpE